MRSIHWSVPVRAKVRWMPGNILETCALSSVVNCVRSVRRRLPDEYQKYFEDKALERRFRFIMVDRARTNLDAISILRGFWRKNMKTTIRSISKDNYHHCSRQLSTIHHWPVTLPDKGDPTYDGWGSSPFALQIDSMRNLSTRFRRIKQPKWA